MLRFLHQLSAFYFYALGISFFLAYILLRKQVDSPWPALWLQVADIPFLLTALLYAGISFLRSIRGPHEKLSPMIVLGVTVPLTAVFVAYTVFNFAPAVL